MPDMVKFVVDADHLAIESTGLVDMLGEFLASRIDSANVVREGNNLTVEVPKKVTKRSLRLRLTKFLHQTDTIGDYRPLSVSLAPNEYKIFRKRSLE